MCDYWRYSWELFLTSDRGQQKVSIPYPLAPNLDGRINTGMKVSATYYIQPEDNKPVDIFSLAREDGTVLISEDQFRNALEKTKEDAFIAGSIMLLLIGALIMVDRLIVKQYQ